MYSDMCNISYYSDTDSSVNCRASRTGKAFRGGSYFSCMTCDSRSSFRDCTKKSFKCSFQVFYVDIILLKPA